MNNKAKVFIKNFSYTLVANFISLFISTLVVVIVPKLVGVKDYSYWQLYLFYASYVGFFQFGWNDGIYLRYGGREYDSLNKKLFFSQFWMLVISQLGLSTCIFIASLLFKIEIERQFILMMVALCMVIMGVRAMLLFILQGTNRVKEYALITMMERILYCILIIAFLLIGVRKYKLMIVADLLGKFISLIYAMYVCKDIVFQKISIFYFSFKETKSNINVGIKLMFASIASMFIIGVVRFGIERVWDVTIFGKLSFALNISNIMMIFINAVGIIMFPVLRRTDEKRLSNVYLIARDILMVVLLGCLIVYYPLKYIFLAWLPKYADSLKYMALLFPMSVFEGKMALLINTYLKTLREEKLMLKINLVTLVLSVVVTFISTVLLKDLNLAIMSIVLLLAFRCALAEMFLSKILTISLYKDIGLELTMTLVFVLTGWFVNSWLTVMLYAGAYIIYLSIKRKDIVNTIKNVKLLVKY